MLDRPRLDCVRKDEGARWIFQELDVRRLIYRLESIEAWQEELDLLFLDPNKDIYTHERFSNPLLSNIRKSGKRENAAMIRPSRITNQYWSSSCKLKEKISAQTTSSGSRNGLTASILIKREC